MIVGQIGLPVHTSLGISFIVFCRSEEGLAELNLIVENQYENKCKVGLLLQSGDIVVAFEFSVAGSGATICKREVGVPEEMQGEERKFFVRSLVSFYDGYGSRMRKSEGHSIHANRELEAALGAALGIPGKFDWTNPKSIAWPSGVAVSLSKEVRTDITEFDFEELDDLAKNFGIG